MERKTREKVVIESQSVRFWNQFARNARDFFRKLSIFENYTHNWRLVLTAAIVGVLPLMMFQKLGFKHHQMVSTVLMLPFFWVLVLKNRFRAGIFFVAAVYVFHGIAAIYLTQKNPMAMAAFFPGGENYWKAQIEWITTGFDPEYDPKNWMPMHFILLVGISFFSVVTLGLIPFYQGFFETDLMNFYVGNLLQVSENQAVALTVGWHTWSVMRGICYSIIVFEMTSWTIEKLTKKKLCETKERRQRWVFGLLFFSLDFGLKFFTMENVRDILFKNLHH